jgi:C4-dicarboxylate-specific signal transduction histidine kinase
MAAQDDDRQLRQEGLAFFGAVTAGQSHEITNVLNIINELAGLQNDLLWGVERGRPMSPAKLKEIADKVQTQVSRGENIIRNINRFAHSVDIPVAMFDLRELLERVTFFAQRPANLQKVRLERDFPAETVSIENSPFGVQQAVFVSIEIALAAAETERRIEVGYRILDERVEITVESAEPVPSSSGIGARLAFLELLMAELGGRVVTSPGANDRRQIVLEIPVRPAAGE